MREGKTLVVMEEEEAMKGEAKIGKVGNTLICFFSHIFLWNISI
jgi:hypothetical protein